jgi:hypothetical protein
VNSSESRRFLGPAIIAAYIIIFAVLQGYPQSVTFDPSGLLLILNTVFLTAICLAVVYIARKSFLVGGPASLLFLGGGVFAYGVSAFLGALMFTFLGVNSYVTINNIGLLLSTMLTFIGAALTVFAPTAQMGSKHKGSTVTVMLLGILVINLALAGTFLLGIIPLFFVQGVGSSQLRNFVVATAIVLLILSSVFLMISYLRAKSRSTILYWYSLGLLMLATAFVAALFQTNFGGWVNWMARIGAYVATGYLLVAIWTTFGQKGPIRMTKLLGLVVIIAYAIVFLSLQGLPQNAIFDPPGLLLVLNTIFLTATCFGVSYIARKSFLIGGPASLLFIGAGIFSYGLAGFVGALMFSLLGANAYVTVNNIGVLLSATLTFIGVALVKFAPTMHIGSEHKAHTVTVMLLGIVTFNLLLVSAFLSGAIPVFFVQGVGASLLREVVITIAIGFFVFSSVLLISTYRRSEPSSSVMYWLSLGFLLIGVSFVGTLFQTSFGDWVNWMARIGWYLGTGYLIAAIWTSYRHEGPIRPNKFLGLTAAIAYVIVLLSVQVLPQNLALYSPTLLFALNTFFLAAIPMLMIYLSRKSFIMSGSYTQLFLGGGIFAIGVTGVLAALMFGLLGINAYSTVNNIGSLFAGTLFFVASALAMSATSKQMSESHKKSVVAATLLLILIFDITLVLAVLGGLMPPFFIQGVGYTPLRQAVVYTEAVVFALPCILFATLYIKSRTQAAPYWTSLGVGIFAFIMFTGTFVQVPGSLLWWTLRLGTYVSMALLLSAITPAGGSRFISQNKGKILGGAIGVAYLSMLVVIQGLPQNVFLNSPALVLVLNITFLSAIPFAVTYISRKSFIMSGSYALLLLSGGMFQLGVAVALSAVMLNFFGFNPNITVFTIGALFSAIMTLASSVLVATGSAKTMKLERKGLAATLILVLVLIVNAGLALAVLGALVPAFIVPGVGATSLRLVTLGATTALFAFSSILFATAYMRSTSQVPTYWFAMGIALFTLGLFASGIVVVSKQSAPVDPPCRILPGYDLRTLGNHVDQRVVSKTIHLAEQNEDFWRSSPISLHVGISGTGADPPECRRQ